jgi:hypothetical protein
MSDWLSPTLEFILTGLKIAGVIGAFIGLSGESMHGPKARLRRIWAYGFLAMAIGAELCDSLLKRIDSREQAVRFERLAHPLGTIRVTPLYAVDLSGEGLSGYKKRLIQEDAFVPPDPKTEPAAYALLNAVLEMHVFIYRDPNSRAGAGEREPDLSFEINLQANQFLRRRTASDQKRRQIEIAAERNYSYSDGEIHAQTEISNSPDDRYSNGLIISSADLLGSELEIGFCPLVMLPNDTQEKEAEFVQKVRLEQVYIAFPGRQEFSIAPSDKKNVRSIAAAGLESCSLLYCTFPSRLEEFKKAQVP